MYYMLSITNMWFWVHFNYVQIVSLDNGSDFEKKPILVSTTIKETSERSKHNNCCRQRKTEEIISNN